MAVSIDEYMVIFVWLCVCVEFRVADKRDEDVDEQTVH